MVGCLFISHLLCISMVKLLKKNRVGMWIMSYIDFTKVINSLGYKSFKCLWYRDPRKTLSRGLKPLNCEFDILQLAEDVFGFDVVEVYMD